MSGNFYIDIAIIVLLQSIIVYIYHYTVHTYKKQKDPLVENLEIVKAILESTKHEKILSLDRIKEFELNSREIFVFSQDMSRDVKNKGQFAEDQYRVGTFHETVKNNLSASAVRYTYFLKKDSHWKHFIHSFHESYETVSGVNDRVDFYLIDADKYFFYDEIYLYKTADEKYSAFEFLPSISNEEEKLLFYLELDDKQIDRLIAIKDNLTKKYEKKKLSVLLTEGA